MIPANIGLYDYYSTVFLLYIGDQTEDYQGKLLVHNEHSILSLLQDQPGVVHHHGLFRESNNIILVLDCLHQHDYDSSGQYKVYIITREVIHLI